MSPVSCSLEMMIIRDYDKDELDLSLLALELIIDDLRGLEVKKVREKNCFSEWRFDCCFCGFSYKVYIGCLICK